MREGPTSFIDGALVDGDDSSQPNLSLFYWPRAIGLLDGLSVDVQSRYRKQNSTDRTGLVGKTKHTRINGVAYRQVKRVCERYVEMYYIIVFGLIQHIGIK